MEAASVLTRRDFLNVGGLGAGAAGLALANVQKATGSTSRRHTRCILLFLLGGPSQIDTWDPKPAAPSNVRGPFRPMHTSVPGLHICEHFPRMAALAQHFAIVRSVCHNAAPVHETGCQLLQTGRLSRHDLEQPHFGAVISHLRARRGQGLPTFALLPGPIGNTGIAISHGQGAGFLGTPHEPAMIDPRAGLSSEGDYVVSRYGRSPFGALCLQARRLVEQGVSVVTVNMFQTVFDRITWDCHANGGTLRSTLDDYRHTLCPHFDAAYTALLEDLAQRGLLDGTLVVAMGEFGRTPHLNAQGGRDHWPGVWSVLLAGGGVCGGQVIGASDRIGAEPRDRPVTPAQLVATIYHALGVDPATRLPAGDGRLLPLVDAEPVWELF
jgi:hypothetical protein